MSMELICHDACFDVKPKHKIRTRARAHTHTHTHTQIFGIKALWDMHIRACH